MASQEDGLAIFTDTISVCVFKLHHELPTTCPISRQKVLERQISKCETCGTNNGKQNQQNKDPNKQTAITIIIITGLHDIIGQLSLMPLIVGRSSVQCAMIASTRLIVEICSKQI